MGDNTVKTIHTARERERQTEREREREREREGCLLQNVKADHSIVCVCVCARACPDENPRKTLRFINKDEQPYLT